MDILLDKLVAYLDLICFGIWSALCVILGCLMTRKAQVSILSPAGTGKAVNMGSNDPGYVTDDPWTDALTSPTADRITGDLT